MFEWYDGIDILLDVIDFFSFKKKKERREKEEKVIEIFLKHYDTSFDTERVLTLLVEAGIRNLDERGLKKVIKSLTKHMGKPLLGIYEKRIREVGYSRFFEKWKGETLDDLLRHLKRTQK